MNRYLALLERRDIDGLDEVVAEDIEVIAPDGTIAFADRATWKQAMADEAFTDERIQVEEMVCEPDKVAVRYTLTATHSGNAFGAPATGARVATSGTKIYTVRGGRITRIAGHDDALGLLRQLGVSEIPPS